MKFQTKTLNRTELVVDMWITPYKYVKYGQSIPYYYSFSTFSIVVFHFAFPNHLYYILQHVHAHVSNANFDTCIHIQVESSEYKRNNTEEMRSSAMKRHFRWVTEYLNLPDLEPPTAKYSYLFNNAL